MSSLFVSIPRSARAVALAGNTFRGGRRDTSTSTSYRRAVTEAWIRQALTTASPQPLPQTPVDRLLQVACGLTASQVDTAVNTSFSVLQPTVASQPAAQSTVADGCPSRLVSAVILTLFAAIGLMIALG